MKLVIQIPCYNEEETLPQVVADLPTEIDGIDEIEYLIIDDGSRDKTVEVAEKLGIHHVLSLGSNHGLAKAFMAGIRKCVELGADLIVNTDGDNQYKGQCIKDLVQPILKGKADMVIGCRPIEQIEEFSWLKKKLQRFGSGVVQKFSGTEVPDTTSGFRAYTAEAAMMLQVFNRYTYTLETIIQAGAMDIRIANVDIQVNPKTRESRLMRSIPSYLWRSFWVILRSYVTYKPFRTFFYTSIVPVVIGLFYCVRFVYFYYTGRGGGHIQSLILAAAMLLIGFNLFTLGIVSYLIGSNRRLINETLFLSRALSRRPGNS